MTQRSLSRIGAFGMAILALALAIAPAAVAGKPGSRGGGNSTGGGSMTLVLMDGDTVPHHGGRVTFDVSTTATDRPFVGLRCWQGSTWVADGYTGYFADSFSEPWFVLDSDYWADGVDASCTARLFYFNKRGGEELLATMTFTVVA